VGEREHGDSACQCLSQERLCGEMEYLGGLESGIKGRLEALPKLEDAAAAGEIAVRSMLALSRWAFGLSARWPRTGCLVPQR
jgi:hypothetical protein